MLRNPNEMILLEFGLFAVVFFAVLLDCCFTEMLLFFFPVLLLFWFAVVLVCCCIVWLLYVLLLCCFVVLLFCCIPVCCFPVLLLCCFAVVVISCIAVKLNSYCTTSSNIIDANFRESIKKSMDLKDLNVEQFFEGSRFVDNINWKDKWRLSYYVILTHPL